MQRFFEHPQQCCIEIVGRLAPDASLGAATAELDVLARQFTSASHVTPAVISLRSTAFVDNPFATQAVTLSALFSAAVLLVLLLGCANVGNLLLARAASRRMDTNVRLALGATRGRLIRQLLSESVTLAVVAGVLSYGVAAVMVPAALQALGEPFQWMTVPVDANTLAFAMALALVVAMIAGTLPALKSTRIMAGRVFVDADREGGRTEKRVVAIVGDVRSQTFQSPQPTYYERATSGSYLLVRGGAHEAERLRALILRVAPDATVSAVDLRSRLYGQIQPALMGASIAATVGMLALLLAAVGTLGVVSYLVHEQVPEIGVRKALGASRRSIVALLLRRVSRPLLGGLAAGLLGAEAPGGVLGANLYGMSPRDPFAYGAVFAILAAAVFAALTGPARRALRVDAARMLRAE